MWCPYYKDGEYKCDLCKNTVTEAKHDNYCTDWNGTNYQDCDIYKKILITKRTECKLGSFYI